MALKSKTNTKILYPMGEVCEMFDLPASTIRFWEKNFTQIKPRKNAKGNRLFTPDDIETLKVIYHLVKEKGMTLSGADKYLRDNKVAAKKESSIVEILQHVRAVLLDIRTEINTYEKQLADEIVIPEQEADAPEQQPTSPDKPHYYEPTLFDML